MPEIERCCDKAIWLGGKWRCLICFKRNKDRERELNSGGENFSSLQNVNNSEIDVDKLF